VREGDPEGEQKLPGWLPMVSRALNIANHQKSQKEEEGYEKDNLLSRYGFTFSFDGMGELFPGAKNDGDKKQFIHSERDMAGVDDL